MNRLFKLIIVVLLLTTIATAKDVREIKVLNVVYLSNDELLKDIDIQSFKTTAFFLMNTDNRILLSFDTVVVNDTNISLFTSVNQSWISLEAVYRMDGYDLTYVFFNTSDVVVGGGYFYSFDIIQQPVNDGYFDFYNMGYWTGVHEIIHFFGDKFDEQNITGFEDIDNQIKNKSGLMPLELYAYTLRDWAYWDELRIGKLKSLGLVFDRNNNQKIEKAEALEAVEYYMNGYEGYNRKEIVTATLQEYFNGG